MDQPRPTSEMMNEAHRRALRHAPLPEWHPVAGGLAGAAAYAGPMILAEEIRLYAMILNAVVGFGFGFYWVQSRRNAYYRAWNRELEALKGGPEPPVPAPTRPIPKWLLRR